MFEQGDFVDISKVLEYNSVSKLLASLPIASSCIPNPDLVYIYPIAKVINLSQDAHRIELIIAAVNITIHNLKNKPNCLICLKRIADMEDVCNHMFVSLTSMFASSLIRKYSEEELAVLLLGQNKLVLLLNEYFDIHLSANQQSVKNTLVVDARHNIITYKERTHV